LLRLLAACLLLACPHAAGQTRPAPQISLPQIERSIEQGRVEEVEQALLAYAVAHPRDVKALELLGRARWRQGRLEEAAALYRRVLALDPSFVRSRINLGHVLYESGHRDEARQLVAGLARTPLADAREQLALAEALAVVGEYEQALAAVERLPAALRNVEGLPVAAASHLALGARQKLTAHLPLMRRAAAASPSVAAGCAEVLHAAGMLKEAVELLRLAEASAPRDAGVLVLLGRLETEAREFAPARRHLERAAALEPRSPRALSARASLESAEGNLTAALALLEEARALEPDSTAVLTQLTLTAMRANRPREATEAAAALVRLKPDEPEFQYLFGAASLQGGNLGAAEGALGRYTSARPEDPRGCLALGITLAGQRDRAEEARAQFERCLQIDPANVEARYQLGLVFKSQGENAKAVALLEEAVGRAPRHAEALRDLGALYLQAGEASKARAVLERALALNAEDAETHFQLSRLYNRLGEAALAQRHLEQFRTLKSRREKVPTP
jgi:tetratricopeptide (TPR) repeat protein